MRATTPDANHRFSSTTLPKSLDNLFEIYPELEGDVYIVKGTRNDHYDYFISDSKATVAIDLCIIRPTDVKKGHAKPGSVGSYFAIYNTNTNTNAMTQGAQTVQPELSPKQQLEDALSTGNPWDLYDAIADNGWETDEVYANSHDVSWLKSYASSILGED